MSFLRYVHDRSRLVGTLRKKYSKEATVFRVKFPKNDFLRGDHSIDLYKARQAVVNELSRVLGDFRDFNGGMISKQHELLAEVRAYFAKEGIKYNEWLLENFFYSLAPVIMRTLLEPHAFKSLFQMMLEDQERGVPPGDKYGIRLMSQGDFTYLVLIGESRLTLEEMIRKLQSYQSGSDLVQGYAKTPAYVCFGYIYRCKDPSKQAQFKALVDHFSQEIQKT